MHLLAAVLLAGLAVQIHHHDRQIDALERGLLGREMARAGVGVDGVALSLTVYRELSPGYRDPEQHAQEVGYVRYA